MSQIVITNKGGEVVRAIDVPAQGITVKDLAQHLREARGGVRPQPFDWVTVGASDQLPDTEPVPATRSCGG
jgi:hypothetical protein